MLPEQTPPNATAPPAAPTAFIRPQPPRRGRSRTAAIVGLAVIGLAAIAGGGFFAYTRLSPQGGNDASLQVTKVAQPETATPDASMPADRDLERYRRISEIRIALDTYENDARAYPASLDALVPKYMETIPKDPASGDDYGYKLESGGYAITFSLEAGVFTLSPGAHVLTTNGFDVPLAEELVHVPAQETTVTETAAPPAETLPESPVPNEPGSMDTDADGLSDAQEAVLGTDPASADTDGDGITDDDELKNTKTDPKLRDTDGDEFSDGDELIAGFDPKNAAQGVRLADADADGLADLYEVTNDLDPNVKDMDGDGLSDGDEIRVFETDPRKADSDGDGFGDASEIQGGFDPTAPGSMSEERKARIDANTEKYGLH